MFKKKIKIILFLFLNSSILIYILLQLKKRYWFQNLAQLKEVLVPVVFRQHTSHILEPVQGTKPPTPNFLFYCDVQKSFLLPCEESYFVETEEYKNQNTFCWQGRGSQSSRLLIEIVLADCHYFFFCFTKFSAILYWNENSYCC